MARNKNQLKLDLPKPTNQEVLLGFVATLKDGQCKEAYQMLLERFNPKRARIMKFNREAIQSVQGKVRLTPRQYEMILENCGEVYFHRAVEILYDYIVHLEERADSEVVARRRLKEYNSISHYYKLTKGWVAQRVTDEMNVQPEATQSLYNESLNFYDIETLEQAREYINQLPNELRINNPEVEFLCNRFPELIGIR